LETKIKNLSQFVINKNDLRLITRNQK
jgi:hypothetical protein